ncbi:hypothetical protein V6N12_028987 [Hibiscus sabdariffa]|uniref:Uncharacterized protein n=1 Tax=Hibiscus sabdariffa TaxID=183260 RepID=A0ABR2F7F1_9ROSI
MYDISCLGSKRSETLFAKARVKQRSMITLFIQATAKIRLVFSTERKLEKDEKIEKAAGRKDVGMARFGLCSVRVKAVLTAQAKESSKGNVLSMAHWI